MTHPPSEQPYVLDDAIGFVLRQATQRHLAIFGATMVHDLTPTQFSALLRLSERGECSQNQLGRLAAMDAPTIKGVVDRLLRRALVAARRDPADARLVLLRLTEAGRAVLADAVPCARRISQATLAPLPPDDRIALLGLLRSLR